MHSFIKKALLTTAALVFVGLKAFALDVNQDELQSVGSSDTIKFSNYMGPHSVVSTADAIRGIGGTLGTQVNKSPETESTVNPNALYSVIHAIDLNDNKGLDADIILINKGAGVDHIDNVRRIITGYLMASYGYSRKDADTLAVFITVYNAVYRNDLSAYESKYKAVVLKYLTKEKCGLSTVWTDWPGNTQIVIPLYDINGGLSTIETSVISDKNVVGSMQQEDDKEIDVRKDMVDLKEREAENAEESAQESAQLASQAAKDAALAKAEADQAQKDAQQAQKDADAAAAEASNAEALAEEARKASDEDPENEAKRKAAEEAELKAKEAQEAAAKAQEAANTAKEQAEIAKQKSEEASKAAKDAQSDAAASQALSDKKQNEAQNERAEIAKDQQKLINEANAAKNRNTVAGLKIKDAVNGLYSIVKLDGDSGVVVKESPVGVIRGRSIFAVSNPEVELEDNSIDTSLFYIAVCGQNKGNGAVKLCLIDNTKLEIQKESNEIVSEDSVLVKNGEDYYCVIVQDSNFVVAKYDKSLKLLLKSPVAVNKATPVVVTEKGVVVTDSKDNVVLLSLNDLSLISK